MPGQADTLEKHLQVQYSSVKLFFEWPYVASRKNGSIGNNDQDQIIRPEGLMLLLLISML
jgi:hypothetical protein